MSVSGVNGATDGSSAAAQSATKSTVSKDEFLLLFVTQLKNQDPMSPMDSTGFTAQLAQFSSLEQLTSINNGIEAVVAYQNSLQNAYVSNFIGKKVGYEETSADGSKAMVYGTVTSVAFDNGKTNFILDGSKSVSIGDIKVIQ